MFNFVICLQWLWWLRLISLSRKCRCAILSVLLLLWIECSRVFWGFISITVKLLTKKTTGSWLYSWLTMMWIDGQWSYLRFMFSTAGICIVIEHPVIFFLHWQRH